MITDVDVSIFFYRCVDVGFCKTSTSVINVVITDVDVSIFDAWIVASAIMC